MQRLEISGAVRPIYGLLGVKRLTNRTTMKWFISKSSKCTFNLPFSIPNDKQPVRQTCYSLH